MFYLKEYAKYILVYIAGIFFGEMTGGWKIRYRIALGKEVKGHYTSQDQ